MMNIKDVSKNIGLSTDFIRGCIKRCSHHFDEHLGRGGNNSILFSNSAYAILEQIASMKKNGLSISSIESELDKSLDPTNGGSKQRAKKHENQTNNYEDSELRKADRALFEKDLELVKLQNQIELRSIKEKLNHYAGDLILITDGRETKAYIEEQAILKEKLDSIRESRGGLIKDLGTFQRFWHKGKRKDILTKLEKLEEQAREVI